MLIPESERQAWNEFVAAAPAGDVLQCWEWGELKARTGWEALPVGVRDGGGLAAVALVLKRRLPRTRRCLFYCPRGPVADPARPDALAELVAGIREEARRHGAIAVKADPAVEAGDGLVAGLQALGFRPPAGGGEGFGGTQPKSVMKVPLPGDEDALLASFHEKWRYNVRLATRKGVRVECEGGAGAVDRFYDLLLVTAQRDGFRVRARSYFQQMRELLLERGLGQLFMTYAGETAVSGAIAFVLGRQCWYVYGASDNDHRHLMPNHLMQWEMMRWAQGRGCSVYDMRGVSPEVDGEPVEGHLAGLNRFKRGFGASYHEYVGDWDLVLSPAWYGLFVKALPVVRRAMARGRTAGGPAE
jgi:peptidoglycan pentaglycine glycine transferase (the first glycine)